MSLYRLHRTSEKERLHSIDTDRDKKIPNLFWKGKMVEALKFEEISGRYQKLALFKRSVLVADKLTRRQRIKTITKKKELQT